MTYKTVKVKRLGKMAQCTRAFTIKAISMARVAISGQMVACTKASG